jgi:8-oxo-dGTP pyrophosphatase MutT (NUDIX family)
MEKPAKVANKHSAGVAILYGSSILLAKRCKVCPITGAEVPFPEYWSIFAGAMNPKECPKDCAVRELFEETEILIQPEDIEFISTKKNTNSVLHIYCFSSDKLILPKLNFEHTQFGWFNVNELDSFTDKIDLELIQLIIDHIHK